MKTYSLVLTASPDELLAASRVITYRFAGRWRSTGALVLIALVGVLAGIGSGRLFGVQTGDAVAISLYAVIGAMFSFLVLQRLATSRHRAEFITSALYGSDVPISLTPDGLRLEAKTIAWSGIGALGRHNDATMVYFSAVDALVIPDRDLPPDLAPEGLAAQIAEWQKA